MALKQRPMAEKPWRKKAEVEEPEVDELEDEEEEEEVEEDEEEEAPRKKSFGGGARFAGKKKAFGLAIVTGLFKNPKSWAGQVYKDLDIDTPQGRVVIPAKVRFVVLPNKNKDIPTDYTLFVSTEDRQR